jgi:hypothetical protein
VAIGFVFDLDEVLYTVLIAKEAREEHETTPAKDDSPLSEKNPRGRALVTRWGWLTFLVDIGYCTAYYIFRETQPTLQFARYKRHYILAHIISRQVVLVAARLHITRNCHHCNTPLPEFALRTCAFVAISLATTALLYTVIIGFIFIQFLGHNQHATLLIPGFIQCVCDLSDTVTLTPADSGTCLEGTCTHQCSALHTVPGLMEELGQRMRQASSLENYLDLAWAPFTGAAPAFLKVLMGRDEANVCGGSAESELTGGISINSNTSTV